MAMFFHGRVVEGGGHLAREAMDSKEFMSLNRDLGTNTGCIFSPSGQLVRLTHSSMSHSKFYIHLDYCPRGEAIINRPSAPASVRPATLNNRYFCLY